MNKNEIAKKINESVMRVAEKQISNIDSIVENLIKSSVCSLLGLSNSWGKTEIDHCNGRNSILTNIIEQKAKDKVEQLVKNFKFDENDKEILEAFKKEFKEQLRRRISWHAEELSKDIAGKIIKRFTDKELEKIGFEKSEEQVKAKF